MLSEEDVVGGRDSLVVTHNNQMTHHQIFLTTHPELLEAHR
jgi:hypothetical protein